jgi:hypothetical protein
MALLHEATISPRKDELIGPWLRTRPWWDGIDERGPVGTFRLDDPADEVGMECFLFGSGAGSTLFVPVTYRAAPLPGAEASLLGPMEHSVLGTRYVYDAGADPVFVATVLDTIRSGAGQAELRLRKADGTEIVRDPIATARGAGVATVPAHDPAQPVTPVDTADRTTVTGAGAGWTLTVMRRLGDVPPGPALTADFEGGRGLCLAAVAAQ